MNQTIRRLNRRLGEGRPRGEETDFDCPKCKKQYKLGVNLRKNLFHCFHCKYGGPLSRLLKHLGIEGSTRPLFNERKGVPADPRIPLFTPITGQAEFDIICFDECRKRANLRPEEVIARGWGWSAFIGLFGRMVVPVKVEGKVVQYLARSVYSFIDPKETRGAERHGWRPDAPLGLDDIKSGDRLVLVEGLWDREAVLRVGHPCLALLGSSLSDRVAGEILSREPSEVVVCLDGGTRELALARAIRRKLRGRSRKLPVDVVELPAKEDPASVEDLASYVR